MTIQTSPEKWPWSTAQAAVCGLDIGLAQDHSTLITAGAWQSGARSIIGVKGIKQFPIGMPLDEVADFTVETARGLGARVVFDCSNNSAFASILAGRFGSNPANVLVAGVITNAADHAAMPTPMMLSVGGLKSAIPRWTLSKRELIECVAAESDGGTLRTGKSGDWEVLREELSSMERTVRASGSVAYSAPSGKHDDLIMALALAVFGLRRIGGAVTRRRARRREPFGVGAWT